MKEKNDGSPLLTEGQKQWVALQKMMTTTTPTTRWQPPPQRWRQPFYNQAIQSPAIDRFIMGEWARGGERTLLPAL